MCSSFILLTWPYHFRRFSVISWPLAPLLLSLYCVHFGYYPSLSLRTSISASSSRLLLVVLLVISLLPRSLHHTTELVPQFCIPSPSASMAPSCHTTLDRISSRFHKHGALTLCEMYVGMPPVSSLLEPRYLQLCNICSSSPRILTGYPPWPLSSPN